MLASVLLQLTPLRANLTAERADLRRAVAQQLRAYREGLSVLPRPQTIPLTYQVWRLQYGQSAAQVLSSEEAITDFFQRDGIDGRLLILGDPGMGKTHTLLAMGEHLLRRNAAEGPVPVLVDLSAWDGENLDAWLVAYLWEVYRLCQPVATLWLQSAQLTLLLDGFDHLPPAQQRACAKEINTLLRSNAEQTALLCCRRQVIETSGISFDDYFNGGLYLRPLPAQQVKDYLLSQGCDDLWPQVKATKALQPLGRFPLYLTLMVALAPVLGTDASAITGKEALVQTFLNDRLDHSPQPASAEERSTLRWLATQMAGRPRSLRIDHLRPTWLPEPQRLMYRGLLALAFVLIFTLVGGNPGVGLAWGLVFSQLDLEAFPYTHLSLALASWRSLTGLALVSTLPALGLGVGVGGFGALLLGRFNLGLPAFGWGGLVGAVLGWSLGLGIGLWGGLPRGIQIRHHPNQDLRMALRNGAILFGLLALVLALVLVVPAVVRGQPPFTLLTLPRLRVVIAALLSAYLWLSFALQQMTVRAMLSRAPSRLPWAVDAWLQRWAQRQVLVKGSGDYGFAHDLVRDALAKD
ncbi:hypothetical protein GFS31_34360 [Leptolyngbya sp. BL0902]|uniref:NACHT domain-containing protein n=1 Tax=Leptolyngbya sp. BL0902 TaxID=1115757 RepID=UPI0018E79EC2|nr:hypothetical protein [Leptolyngbya sp. BL0902]QQE66735.1 hypothetical protein GFS31_34360 [Leptolyngbya sp. BL0902]